MTDGGVGWVRAAKGVYLLGVGTFLLLCAQDVLPWSFWRDAIAFWPVLLVAAGIRLIFERTRLAWLVLLGPALVLGTLMYVAGRGPAAPWGPADWEDLRTERPAGAGRWTLQGRLALTTLDIAARPLPRAILLQGKVAPSGRTSLRLTAEGDAGRVRITDGRRPWRIFFPSPAGRRACELRLSQALPLALDLDLALTEGTIDVASAPVSGVVLDGALNDLTLRLGAPRGPDDVGLRLEGAFNDIELIVPSETPVRLDSDGFANLVDGREGTEPLRGPAYRVRVHGAFNRLVVESG